MRLFSNKKIKSFWNILRPLLVCAALYILFRSVNLSSLWNGLHTISAWTVLLFLMCAFSLIFFQGFRWWLLIRAFTDKLSFLESMSIHFSSVFYSLVLPNSTVQEVVRTVYVTKTTGYVIGWSSAWVCKIMGVVVSFAFSIIGLLILPELPISPIVYKIIVALFILMCIAIMLSFTKKVSRPVRNILSRYVPQTSFSWFENLREGIYRFRDKKKAVLLSLFVTILAQLLMLAGVAILLKGITGQAYFTQVVAFIPLIEMISMAQPFTPGGIGVREALVAVMFKHLNLTTEQLAVYVVISNASMLLKLTGVVPVIYKTIKAKNAVNAFAHNKEPKH